MRGNLLNRKGEFNRCSLTRLGVDQKWEDARWKKSWEDIVAKEDDTTIYMLESEKTKRPEEVSGLKGAKRLKMESEGSVWGEHVDQVQVERNKFLMSNASERVQAKQSLLPILKGSEWISYSLVKEMAWEAVDRAMCVEDMATWEEWNGSECDIVADVSEQAGVCATTGVPSECGTAQMVGGGAKSKTKRKKPKSKLPGVSANQKSVAAFFTAGNKPKLMGVQHEVQNNCLKGGEEVSELNSFELSGEHRSNYIPSPTSKNIFKKSRSVASSQKIFLQEQNEGGGGLTKSVQKNSKNSENILVPYQSQNWRQKLQVYRAEQS